MAIQKRGKKTISGANPFLYFDGPTMSSYQAPPRSIETVFCRRQPTPLECLDARIILNPEVPSAPISSFEVKASEEGKTAGRGLYTNVAIPASTYIALEQGVHTLDFYPRTYKIIADLNEEGPIPRQLNELHAPRKWKSKVARQYDCLEYYVHGYGFTSRKRVSLSCLPLLMCFIFFHSRLLVLYIAGGS